MNRTLTLTVVGLCALVLSGCAGRWTGSDYWQVAVTTNGVSFVPLEFTSASEQAWVEKSFDLSQYIGLDLPVQFRFLASDYGSESIVEAGLDEFRIGGFVESPETAAPPDAL